MASASTHLETRLERFYYTLLEVLLIFTLFAIFAGRTVPDVGESHYMVKAKHFWDRSWIERDLFLQSADAHYFFYWIVGGLTQWLPLPAATWLARIAAWMLLAFGWQRLSHALVPGRLVGLLSAAWLLALTHWCSMSGEWIVGGIEAKAISYPFVFLGLAALARDDWRTPWLWFGVATLFHVIVGGWCFVSGLVAWAVTRPQSLSPWRLVLWMTAGIVIALPAVLIGLRLSDGESTAAQTAVAHRIVVYFRLAHHMDFGSFLPRQIALFGLMTAVWAALGYKLARHDANQRRLHAFTLGTVLIGAGGLVLYVIGWRWPNLAAQWLRFYWFRPSDAMVPAATALALVGLVRALEPSRYLASQRLLAALILGATALVLPVVHRTVMDRRPRSITVWDNPARSLEARQRRLDEWINACRWIAANTPRDALFITPWAQQTFKWYAERAEVFNWKDVPQDVPHQIEWRRRWKTLYPREVFLKGPTAMTDDELVAVAERYGAEYIVVQRWRMLRPLGERFEMIYPSVSEENSSFAVYRIRATDRP